MKTAFYIILGICAIAAAGFFLIFPGYYFPLRSNWGVELPIMAGLYLESKTDTGPSPHGDGIRYHRYSYKYEDFIDLMFAWGGTEKEALYGKTLRESAEEWMGALEVPAEKRPGYESCLAWHKVKPDNSQIIIIWESERNLLHILENFI